MTSTNDSLSSEQLVQARPVPDSARMNALPKHFGRRLIQVEAAIYNFLGRLAPDYRGAYWRMVELSSGGFYMYPDVGPLHICVEGNGWTGELTAEAAGITACLFAYSHLSFLFSDDDLLTRHFLWLRDYAAQHAEAAKIFAAID